MSNVVVQRILLTVFHTTAWSCLSALDLILITFNACESLIWFICAWCVARRNMRYHRNVREYIYALLFVAFGLSDVVEVFQLSAPLLWATLCILVPLFLLRQRVRTSYTPKPRLI